MSNPRKTRQGGFVGIQQYLGAQGNAGQRLAENVGQNLTTQHGQAQTGIQGLQGQFGTQSEAAKTSDISQQIKDDPTQVTNEQFGKTVGGYQGPMGLQSVGNYGGVLGQVGQVGQNLDYTKNQAGQGVLLKDQFGKPSYTRGQTRLDTAILGAAPGARSEFANLRQSLGGLGDQLSSAEQAAASQAQAYQQAGLQHGQLAQDTLSSQKVALKEALDKQASIANALGNLSYSGALAMAPDAKKQFYSKNPVATISDIASEEQRARDAALARLSGDTTFTSEVDKPWKAFTFDDAGYQSWLAKQKPAAAAPTAKQAPIPISGTPDQVQPGVVNLGAKTKNMPTTWEGDQLSYNKLTPEQQAEMANILSNQSGMNPGYLA